jgi:two-component system, LytTR family, sensor kinase
MTKNKRYWMLQISCWAIYVSYMAFVIFFYVPQASKIIIAAITNFCLFVSLTHIYHLVVRRWNIETLKWYKFLIYPISANVLVSLVVGIVNELLFHLATYFSPQHKGGFGYFISIHLLDMFRFVMPWFIFYHGIKFAEKAIKNEREKLDAQTQLKLVELDNLRNQLNPHFLFNSLNSIRSLTLSDPKMAREATTKLSDLLRTALTYNDLQEIHLEEEINLVNDYLSLEKIRFEDRLTYRIKTEKSLMKVRVPPMSLQLLAENAVKHGIGKTKTGGEILIYAHRQEGQLVFGVKNSGKLGGVNPDKNQRKGLGLENLRKRLLLNYGIENGLKISSENNTVTAEVCIPLKVG